MANGTSRQEKVRAAQKSKRNLVKSKVRLKRRPLSSSPSWMSRLTKTQIPVAAYVLNNKSDAQIASALEISEADVKATLGEILQHLGFPTRERMIEALHPSSKTNSQTDENDSTKDELGIDQSVNRRFKTPIRGFREKLNAIVNSREPIFKVVTDEDSQGSTYAKKMAEFASFVRDNPDKSTEQCVSDFFDRPLALEAPKEAPEKWRGHQSNENPVEFINRVYARWLGPQGPLARADLQTLDSPLYNALAQHIARHGEPSDLNLPKRTRRASTWVEMVSPDEITEMRRVLRAYDRHVASKNK